MGGHLHQRCAGAEHRDRFPLPVYAEPGSSLARQPQLLCPLHRHTRLDMGRHDGRSEPLQPYGEPFRAYRQDQRDDYRYRRRLERPSLALDTRGRSVALRHQGQTAQTVSARRQRPGIADQRPSELYAGGRARAAVDRHARRPLPLRRQTGWLRSHPPRSAQSQHHGHHRGQWRPLALDGAGHRQI